MVAYDSVGPSASGAGTTSAGGLTWTHTAVAGGVAIVAFCDCDTSVGSSTMSATCDGNAMTSLGTTPLSSACFGQAWIITGRASGAHTIAITATAGYISLEGGSIAATGYTGHGTVASSSGTSINPAVTVAASTSGNLCAGFCAVGNNIVSLAGPATSRFIVNTEGSGGANTGNAAGGTSPSTGSAVTFTWTSTSSGDSWVSLGVELQGSAAASGGHPPPVWRPARRWWTAPRPSAVTPAVSTAAAVAAPLWQAQPRRPGPARARTGRSLVAAGLIGSVGLTGSTPSPGLPRISHPAPQRAHTGPAGRNAAGIFGPANHGIGQQPPGLPRIPHPHPQRAIGRGVAGGPNRGFQPPPGPRPPRIVRPLQRAIWHGNAGPGNHGLGVTPPAGLPRIPHPVAVRVVWRGQQGPPNHAAAGQPVILRAAWNPRGPQRVLWRSVAGPQPAAQAAVTPAPAWRPQPRPRPLQRALWKGAPGPVNHGYAPPPSWKPQPRRPGPSRAIGRGQPGGPNQTVFYVAVPAPSWKPLPPRRGPARVLWRGAAGPANHAAAALPLGLPKRIVRPLQRALWGRVLGPPNHSFAPPPGVQPRIAHPQPQRALWRGQAAPPPRPGPPAQQFTQPRRPRPLRAVWRGSAVPSAAVPGVAVPAPRLLRQPPRRVQLLRAIWRAIYGRPAVGGQPISATLLAGTVTQIPYAGVVTTLAYAGTITPASYAGTTTVQPFGGTVTGGIVGVQSDLTAIVGNDEYYYLALTYNGVALNLTGYTVKAYLKATRLTPDADAVVYLSGSGLTITNTAGGLVTWDIPHVNLPNPSTLWYRVDVIDASLEVFTALYGNLQVQPA